MKYLKTYNEKLGDKLVPPTNDDILSKMKDLSTYEIIEKSIDNNFFSGLEFLYKNRKNELSKNMIYIIERYLLDIYGYVENYIEFLNEKFGNDYLIEFRNYANTLYIDKYEIYGYLNKEYKLTYYEIILLLKLYAKNYFNFNDNIEIDYLNNSNDGYSEDFDISYIFEKLNLKPFCIGNDINPPKYNFDEDEANVIWDTDLNTNIYTLVFKRENDRKNFIKEFKNVSSLNDIKIDFNSDYIEGDFKYDLELNPIEPSYNDK